MAFYLRFTDKQLRIAPRRSAVDTDEFKDRYRWRAGVEATMSMHQLKISFVESVKWLMRPTAGKSTVHPATGKLNDQPTTVGDILAGMLAAPSDRAQDPLSGESIPQRIKNLEHNVRRLYRLIDELRSSFNQK